MKVFMSWSGERSRMVGELLDQWLQCVIQALDPWMSTKDIDRGALWFTEINNQLKDISVGIIVLTRENKEKPWILFEAGALAKGLTSSRVCIVLVDLKPSEVRDPLAQFNLTFPDKKGIWNLVSTLNSSLQEKALKEKVLEQVFETYWPQFEEGLQEILASTPENPSDEKTAASTDELLSELINNTRHINRRLRDLEMTSENRYTKSKNSPMSKHLRELVRDLLIRGLDDESIIEILAEQAPKTRVKQTIIEQRTLLDLKEELKPIAVSN